MTEESCAFKECPACGCAAQKCAVLFASTLFEKPCKVRKCSFCGLVFKEWFAAVTRLADIYSPGYVHFDAASEPGPAEVNSAKQKLSRCRALMKGPRQPNELRLLDVGCGAGGFVKIARNLGYAAEGIDPNLPDDLGVAGLQRATPEQLAPRSYDIVTLLNVAEHVPEPKRLFRSVHRVLNPGGVMLLTCPYGDSFARRLHEARWVHLALDEHVLFWTPNSLTRLLRDLHFDGTASFRIAGSPFPFGRNRPLASVHERLESVAICGQNGVADLPVQTQVWKLARWIQKNEKFGNVVRQIINLTRTGDYLEYAISVGK